MTCGTLEVLLVKAKDLENMDWLGKMDPYVLLTLRSQEKKSTVVKGTDPEWNETFQFTVTSDDNAELRLRIMDKDTFTSDNFVGESTIPLEPVFMEGKIAPKKYNVVDEKKEYNGEIEVGLTFISKDDDDEYGGKHGGRRHGNCSSVDDGSGRGSHGKCRDDDDDDDGSRRGGHGRPSRRSDDVDDDCGGTRRRHGGGRQSSRYEEESYGGYKESLYRD